jgi:hypothetical protein
MRFRCSGTPTDTTAVFGFGTAIVPFEIKPTGVIALVVQLQSVGLERLGICRVHSSRSVARYYRLQLTKRWRAMHSCIHPSSVTVVA